MTLTNGFTITFTSASMSLGVPFIAEHNLLKLRDAPDAHPIAAVTGLQSALDSKISASEKGSANGVASLDAGGKVPSAQLQPATMAAHAASHAAAGSDALTLAQSQVTNLTTDLAAKADAAATTAAIALKLNANTRGVANGVASLDASTKVPTAQLPAYVSSVNGSSGAVTVSAASLNAQPLDADLTAIAALSATGYAKRTGANTWELQPSIPWSYVSARPTTLSGYGLVPATVAAEVSPALPMPQARNALHNPLFAIAARAADPLAINADGGPSQFDRWSVICAGASVGTIERKLLPEPSDPPSPLTPVPAGVYVSNAVGAGLMQRSDVCDIPGVCAPHDNKIVSFSVYVKNVGSTDKTVHIAIIGAYSVLGWIPNDPVSDWANANFGASAFFGTGSSEPIASADAVVVAGNAAVKMSATGAIDTTGMSQIAVVMWCGSDTEDSGSIEYTQMQLERGAPSDFAPVDLSSDKARCATYFEVPSGTFSAVDASATETVVLITYARKIRAAYTSSNPSVRVIAPAGNINATVNGSSASASYTSVTVLSSSPEACTVKLGGMTGRVAGRACFVSFGGLIAVDGDA